MEPVRLAIAGVGNCASALLQGIEYYRQRPEEATGLMRPLIGGRRVWDIKVVAAFDIDSRKIGTDVSQAVFSEPNCAAKFQPTLPKTGVNVKMGPVLDGVADHMVEYPDAQRFMVADGEPVDVAAALKEARADVLVSYMPVGSEDAARHYAQAAIDAGCAFVNCMPAFIASDDAWAQRFVDAGLPVVGDDIKSQLGATIAHRVLARLFAERGVRVDRTYQLNTGGNTDFLNMLERRRLVSKKISKTQSVQSQLPVPLPPDMIHIGPSDYVPWLNDNKLCFLRIEGSSFGKNPIELELRLSVQDSPNSAGCAVDAIRVAKSALERGMAGPLEAISACTMKHPPQQFPDDEAARLLDAFLGELSVGTNGAKPHAPSAHKPQRAVATR